VECKVRSRWVDGREMRLASLSFSVDFMWVAIITRVMGFLLRKLSKHKSNEEAVK
jgi:hypothetical protein